MDNDYGLGNRRYVVGGVAVVIIFVYIIRLFTLQIMSDDYKKNADSNAFLKKVEYPARGVISDRNGKLLVYNQNAYDIMVVMNEEKGRLDTLEFCRSLGISREFFDARMAEIKNKSKNPGYSPFTQQMFMSQLSEERVQCFSRKDLPFPRLLCPASQCQAVHHAIRGACAWRCRRGFGIRHRGRFLLPAWRLHRQARRGEVL